MPSARYIPRSYCRPKAAFGTETAIQWADPSKLSVVGRSQLGASKLQHQLAIAMRRAIEVGPGTIEAYAAESDARPVQVGRKLNGVAVMKLEDIAAAEWHLGEALRAGGWVGFPFAEEG